MSTKKQTLLISIACAIILCLCAALFWFWHRAQKAEQEMSEVVEVMTYEKEQLEVEYQDIALEMEGFSYKTNNDSLLKKLDVEQQRVQMLLEELRTVKSTDARRIAELKKELATVRKVLVYYIAQVDSLNQVNQQLTSENKEVHERYQQANQTVTQLSNEKTKLEQKMVLASQLEAQNVIVRTETSNGRKTNSIRRITNIKVSFSILKNVSSSIGMKTLYMRITMPDNNVLTKNPNASFQYEDRKLAYSSKKEIEYKGEDLENVIYYAVDETLFAGNYRVDLFIDGHLIGTTSFNLEK